MKRFGNRKIPQCCLHKPVNSSFVRMLDPRNNQGLITFKIFDHRTFDSILSKFKPYFDMFTPYKNNQHDHGIKL